MHFWDGMISVDVQHNFTDFGGNSYEAYTRTFAPTEEQAQEAADVHFRFMLTQAGVPWGRRPSDTGTMGP